MVSCSKSIRHDADGYEGQQVQASSITRRPRENARMALLLCAAMQQHLAGQATHDTRCPWRKAHKKRTARHFLIKTWLSLLSGQKRPRIAGWQFGGLFVGLSFGPSVKLKRSYVQSAHIAIKWAQNIGPRIGPSFGLSMGPSLLISHPVLHTVVLAKPVDFCPMSVRFLGA